jgi:hypothetical protein
MLLLDLYKLFGPSMQNLKDRYLNTVIILIIIFLIFKYLVECRECEFLLEMCLLI